MLYFKNKEEYEKAVAKAAQEISDMADEMLFKEIYEKEKMKRVIKGIKFKE